jgi:large subunit ribosomal protein L9
VISISNSNSDSNSNSNSDSNSDSDSNSNSTTRAAVLERHSEERRDRASTTLEKSNMKIILKEEVRDLGHPGEVVEVREGYARNFLLPKKMAVPATPGQLKDHAKRIQAAKAREEKERDEARALGDRLQETHVTVIHRASEGSTRLHGSVTAQDIADALRQSLGSEIDRRSIDLRQPIRSLGNYQVNVKLVRGVTVPVQVRVADPAELAAEKAAAEAEKTAAEAEKTAVAPPPEAETAAEEEGSE